MRFFQYLQQYGASSLPDPGHWAVPGGLGLLVLFLAYTAYRDLTRPELVPDDRGPHPRVPFFLETVAALWIVAAGCLMAWVWAGGSMAALGFRMLGGFGGWAGLGVAFFMTVLLVAQLVGVHTSEKMRKDAATQLDQAKGYDWIRPGTRREYVYFQLMAITAGITEELVFRGFLIGVLSLWMSPWSAATLSVLIFVGAHVYQGLSGMQRILPISVILTLVFMLTGSLFPAMALHVAIDVLGGAMMWRIRGYRGTTGRGGDGPGHVGAVRA